MEKNYARSTFEAMSPLNVLKKIVFFVGFGILLQFRTNISILTESMTTDVVSGVVSRVWHVISTISVAIWSSLKQELGNLWNLVWTFGEVMSNASVTTMFGILIAITALVGVVYQPVSFLLEVLDGGTESLTSLPVKLFITIIVVLMASAVVSILASSPQIEIPSTPEIPQLTQNYSLPPFNNTVGVSYHGVVVTL